MIPSRLSNAETRELATSVVTDGVKQHRLDSGGNHVLDRGTATPVFINGHSSSVRYLSRAVDTLWLLAEASF